MHSSRMRTVRSLTVSRHILHTHDPTTMHAPLATTHAPRQPHTTSNHAHPWQAHMPPGHHACPPATAHPPTMHAPPQLRTPPLPRQPRMPPLSTEFLTHAYENITLPQTSFAGGNDIQWHCLSEAAV